MIFHQIPSGGDRNFGYLIGCEKTRLAAVIDPSPDPQFCGDKVRELGLQVIYVINTHCHYDHTGGNDFFKKWFHARVVTHRSDFQGEVQVDDNHILPVGELTLRFFHTPGHTPESMCILAEQELMTGDTLFVGKVGGTHSRETAARELDSLKKLMALPDDIRVWPGHDYGIEPTSTIGKERQSNPFIQRLDNPEEFLWLKDNWADYKLEHGIL